MILKARSPVEWWAIRIFLTGSSVSHKWTGCYFIIKSKAHQLTFISNEAITDDSDRFLPVLAPLGLSHADVGVSLTQLWAHSCGKKWPYWLLFLHFPSNWWTSLHFTGPLEYCSLRNCLELDHICKISKLNEGKLCQVFLGYPGPRIQKASSGFPLY